MCVNVPGLVFATFYLGYHYLCGAALLVADLPALTSAELRRHAGRRHFGPDSTMYQYLADARSRHTLRTARLRAHAAQDDACCFVGSAQRSSFCRQFRIEICACWRCFRCCEFDNADR